MKKYEVWIKDHLLVDAENEEEAKQILADELGAWGVTATGCMAVEFEDDEE